MAGTVEFELVSPERLLLSEQVAMVVVPGEEGNFGVLPGHAPLISTVRPGVIDVYASRAEVSSRIFIAGGFAEVTATSLSVLAEQAAAFDGQRGGLLWAVSKEDGARQKQIDLDTTPVWDGMAAAEGRLFLATTNGYVTCYTGRRK